MGKDGGGGGGGPQTAGIRNDGLAHVEREMRGIAGEVRTAGGCRQTMSII